MSDFMERARAEAERRWGYFINQHGWENVQQACNFMEGAAWARDVLLADPTDGEVEALGWIVGEALGRYQIDEKRAAARAAIAAFLTERRGSE